jgi:hypothetical protein
MTALLICALNGFVLTVLQSCFPLATTFLGESKTFMLKRGQAILAYAKVKAQKCSFENT